MKLAHLLIILTVITSCNSDVVVSSYHSFENPSWPAKDTIHFNFNITNTSALYTANVMLRHTPSYPYDNMYVFLTTVYPQGQSKTDTVNLILADAKGIWLGSGMGDLYDLKIPLKRQFRFSKAGTYKIQLVQAMDIDPLPEIVDVGFELVKISE